MASGRFLLQTVVQAQNDDRDGHQATDHNRRHDFNWWKCSINGSDRLLLPGHSHPTRWAVLGILRRHAFARWRERVNGTLASGILNAAVHARVLDAVTVCDGVRSNVQTKSGDVTLVHAVGVRHRLGVAVAVLRDSERCTSVQATVNIFAVHRDLRLQVVGLCTVPNKEVRTRVGVRWAVCIRDTCQQPGAGRRNSTFDNQGHPNRGIKGSSSSGNHVGPQATLQLERELH
mmetsp:Transcript_46922/g.69431  ORF Transcript_46922/g.69431 Transcript_46922/m.69431 type:complete len:231 (-) Transcript_46922:1723-2415(-)